MCLQQFQSGFVIHGTELIGTVYVDLSPGVSSSTVCFLHSINIKRVIVYTLFSTKVHYASGVVNDLTYLPHLEQLAAFNHSKQAASTAMPGVHYATTQYSVVRACVCVYSVVSLLPHCRNSSTH